MSVRRREKVEEFFEKHTCTRYTCGKKREKSVGN